MLTAVAEAQANAPTPERARHDEIEVIETIQAGVRSHRVIDQIDRLVRRGRLGDDEEEGRALKDVALKYHARVRLAGFEPKAQAAGWQRVDNGGPGSEMAHVAWDLIRKADASMGETQASAVRAVVVEGWSPGAWAHKRGYTQAETGLAFLVDGLRLLRRHWGM